jgi:formylglycine-generating enzyme required for sulfatase activity
MARIPGFLLLVCTLSCALFAQPAAKKRALVIGNGAYRILPKVPPSHANAEAVRTQLTALGFETDLKLDLDQKGMAGAIRAFAATLQPGDIVFFYYSGYGMEEQGENFLLPVSYDPADTTALGGKAISLSILLDGFADRNAGQRIIVLDAAWECPRIPSAGLANMPPMDHTLISFPAAPSSALKLPAKEAASRFTAALVDTLKTPGLKLMDVFNTVDNAVSDQRPYSVQSAIDNFFFIPPKPPEAKVIERPVTAGENRANPVDQLIYVWIPPGNFQMGCVPGDKKCKPDEQPRHQVTISKGFWISNSEVTRSAYDLFLKANPEHKPPGKTQTSHGGYARDVPISRVTWQDAQDYCKWAGGRLPTEAEWEYAARGGKADETYPWGDTSDSKQANFIGAKGGVKKGYDETTPVKSYPANGWHLFDMAGNVREWVEDIYRADAYQSSTTSGGTSGGTSGSREHVVRGGGWYSSMEDLRSSARDYARKEEDNTTGFRCALPVLELR